MTLIDALVVTVLGVSVVFAGLALTYFVIVAIIRIPLLMEKLKRTPVPPAAVEPKSPKAVLVLPSSETMAIIATVLEVELRLRNSMANTRFTFRRS